MGSEAKKSPSQILTDLAQLLDPDFRREVRIEVTKNDLHVTRNRVIIPPRIAFHGNPIEMMEGIILKVKEIDRIPVRLRKAYVNEVETEIEKQFALLSRIAPERVQSIVEKVTGIEYSEPPPLSRILPLDEWAPDRICTDLERTHLLRDRAWISELCTQPYLFHGRMDV